MKFERDAVFKFVINRFIVSLLVTLRVLLNFHAACERMGQTASDERAENDLPGSLLGAFCSCSRRDRELSGPMSPLKPQPSFSKFDHPFLEAVADGDLNSLRQQADSDPGVILAARDAKGNTAAHVAAALGRLPEFEFLVDREPSLLLAANEVRSTPAHRAAEHTKRWYAASAAYQTRDRRGEPHCAAAPVMC